MKKINPPPVNDIQELRLLANNDKLNSYPDLRDNYLSFLSQYDEYVSSGGNPWHVTSLNVTTQFKRGLIAHYHNPPKGTLGFIKKYRDTLSPMVCPMCGSFGNGTIDHYLPKKDYPEFSFFSKNLVPACKCNSLRGTTVKGVASPSRAIHPYYDDFLNERLYQAVFKGDFEAPSISIEVIDDAHPQKNILKFHLDEVIINDATQGWFEKHWSDLSQRPHDKLKLILPALPQIVTAPKLKVAIEGYRNHKDSEYDTPNNWYSIFYTGLMNDMNRLKQLAKTINSLRS